MRISVGKLPLLSASLGILVCLVMLLPAPAHLLLYFDHARIAAGSFNGLITGHWIHADWEHLAWNALALIVLASIIEMRSRALLITTLCIGMLFVDILLFSPFNSIARYCGLSGVLNTLLGVVLILYWKETRSRLILVLSLLCIAKIVIEVYSGQGIITHISWPPYAIAHVAGLLGAPIAWCFHCLITCHRERTPTIKYKHPYFLNV